MRRYYLKNPNLPAEFLRQRGQLHDKPIYEGLRSKQRYLLCIGRDFRRFLVPVDDNFARVGTQVCLVDAEWGGEPIVTTMDAELWAGVEKTTDDSSDILDAALSFLREGNVILLTENDQIVGKLIAKQRGNNWSVYAMTGQLDGA